MTGLVNVNPVRAFTSQVRIQQLPGYVNTNHFKLSCSAITPALTDGDSSTTTYAQFYVAKSGSSEVAFGPNINLSVNPCQVQVTGLQITEEASFTFTVKLDSGESSSTTTIFDNSGPSPVSGYYKDGLSDGVRIHWTNPSDSDFSKVIIYRGETPDFPADSSHEITTQPGGAGAPMTYEDHTTPPQGKTFYYNLRAIDKAGNSSALVGDGQEAELVSSTTSPASEESEIIVLPKKEESQGSILGAENNEDFANEDQDQPKNLVEKFNQIANQTPQPLKWILTHKKISAGIIILLSVTAFIFLRSTKRKNK